MIVFEDDSRIYKSFLPKLNSIIEANLDFDILYLWNGNWNRITWVIGGVIVVWRQMRVSGVTTEAFLTINGWITSAQVHVVSVRMWVV